MGKLIATPEEIKQHDEEYRLRKKYWHVLAYVDHVWEGDYDRWFYDDIEVIRKRMEPYDLDSMCDMTTTPEHRCVCRGAGIRLR
jgi:hypothetical protein